MKLNKFGRYAQMPVKSNYEVATNQTFEADLGEWQRDMEIFLNQMDLVMSSEYYE